MQVRVSLLGALLVMAACGSSSGSATSPTPTATTTTSTTLATSATVEMTAGDYVTGKTQSAFAPGNIDLAAGGSVTWANKDSITHTSTSNTNVWASEIGAGASFTRQFPTVGSFDYKCTIHPGMTGTITVK
jgi:plastocyanin